MKFNYFLIIVLSLFLFSCSKDSEIPIPEVKALATQTVVQDATNDNCVDVSFKFNYEFESYQLGNQEPQPFSSEFSVWIPDEGELVFYIISYDLELCDFLFMNLGGFDYVLEEIGNPDGYWYEVTVSPLAFQSILHGETIQGKFQYQSLRNPDCFTQNFTADLNSEVYEFGNGFLEFDNNFSMSADFFPTPCIKIYSKNRHLCEYLHLDLSNYAYTLEQVPEPHYLVTLPFDDLVPLVNGEAIFGRFEYQYKAINQVEKF